MMFSGVFIKSKTTPKYLAIAGIILVFVANALELNVFNTGSLHFNIDTKEMLNINSFNLSFIAVVLACTLLFFFIEWKSY